MIRMNLGTQPGQNKIEQAQLRWFGHLNRMDEERLTKQVWEARTDGLGLKRPRGRPCRTWNDNIQELRTKKEHHVEKSQDAVERQDCTAGSLQNLDTVGYKRNGLSK
jgi:hypothetical protein